MSNVLDAIPSESREVIVKQLSARDPALLSALLVAQEPTDDQIDEATEALNYALSENFGPGHVPNAYGLVVERSIGAFYDAWPAGREITAREPQTR